MIQRVLCLLALTSVLLPLSVWSSDSAPLAFTKNMGQWPRMRCSFAPMPAMRRCGLPKPA